MNKIELLSQIESILYMANSPVNIYSLSDFFKIDKDELLDIIIELKNLRNDTGINIKIDGNNIFLSTNAKYAEILNSFFKIETKTRNLSKANMETLAIIAYKGKVTKAEIENVRGVNSDSSVSILLEKKLIYSKERKNAPGKPKLFEVTDDFYKYLNLENEEDMWNLININRNEEKEENEN